MGLFGGQKDEEQQERRNEIARARDELERVILTLKDLKSRREKALQRQNVGAATKWEYIVRDNPSGEEIGGFGSRGWELVNFAPFTTGWGIGGNEAYKVTFRYVFKRPVVGLESAEVTEMDEQIEELERAQHAAEAMLSALGGPQY